MPSQSQLNDYFEYLRIPSISADPAYRNSMLECCIWLNSKFSGLGFQSQILETAGAPVVLAKSGFSPKKKTVLIYGHYDVQPVDPEHLWTHPPFEPVIENGFVVARGATDNKGQTFCHILGTEALLKSGRELPVNVVYLLEGQEEIGSPHLGAFLREHRHELACDIVLVSDTSMVGPAYPAITCGLRGISCLEIKVTGPTADMHSGMYGGTIANPARELSRLLARLHNDDGSVAIPGFYDHVLPLSGVDRETWRDIPFGENEILAATGSPKLSGENGYSALERIWVRPTAEINGITAGYQGPGSKTIVPTYASAKLSFRLVPHQKPEQIAAQAREYLTSICPDTVRLEITYDHGGEPYYLDPENPYVRIAREALTEVFGRQPWASLTATRTPRTRPSPWPTSTTASTCIKSSSRNWRINLPSQTLQLSS
ncbi:MAG TPA: M20/M25/M40 family metallo-hydrolase [Chthoniobacterales bacterium]